MNSNPDVSLFLAQALKQSAPSVRNKAQFKAFMLVFDSLTFLTDSICSGDKEMEKKAQEALSKAIGALHTATALTAKVKEISEESRGPLRDLFSNY
jgi:hypothetical protein